MELVERKMIAEFGKDIVDQTRKELTEYFGIPVNNLKTYFEMLDTRVAELKQQGGGGMMHIY